MRKPAKDIKKGDKLVIAGEVLTVESVELSDLGKQGSQKCRIEAKKGNGEKIVMVRPADYPLETK